MSGGAGSLDMDYTTALNLFLCKGLKEFFKDSLDDDDLRYLVANDKAKLEITLDHLEEMKKDYPLLQRMCILMMHTRGFMNQKPIVMLSRESECRKEVTQSR